MSAITCHYSTCDNINVTSPLIKEVISVSVTSHESRVTTFEVITLSLCVFFFLISVKNNSYVTVWIYSRRLRPERFPAVAQLGQQQSNISRRKPLSSSSSSTPSANRSLTSGPTQIVYKEHLNRFSESDLNLPFWQRNWFILLLLVMALSFFGLAIFLFLSLDPDYNFNSPVSATSSQGVEITYGSVIKLMHERTKFRLHSHDVPYGSGSGQQSVTGFPNVDDSNSYWIVRPILDSSAKQGNTIKSGTIIRLQHMRTRRWLHSHLHASPISGNIEVSCFGDDSNSDTGDYWRLETEGSRKSWRQDQKVRLHHVDTGGYLHSHDKKYSRIAGGQQEVCGVRDKRPDNIWLASEGVYLPVTESK